MSKDDTNLNDLWAHEWTRSDWTRRQSLDLLAKGGLGASLAASGLAMSGCAASVDDEVRIGYLPITDATALLVAQAKGFFEAQGLKVAPPTLVRSWSALVEGFAAGKFNLVHLLKPIPVWMRYNNKYPVKIISWAHTNGSGLVVSGKSEAKDFSDLGGTRIAVPYWYSMHNVVLQYALREVGLKPVITNDKPKADEVALQILPPPEMPAGLAAGKIDGYIVAEPFNAMGEVNAGARMLRFTGDIWKNHPCCVIAAHENDTKQRPEFVQKMMNAVVDAQIYTSANKAEIAHLISKDGSGLLPMPAKVIKKAMTDYGDDYVESGAIQHRDWGNGRIDFQPWPYPSATKLIVEAMGDTKVEGDATFLKGLDPQFVADDLVDTRFVRQALKGKPEWVNDPSVDPNSPFERKEILSL